MNPLVQKSWIICFAFASLKRGVESFAPLIEHGKLTTNRYGHYDPSNLKSIVKLQHLKLKNDFFSYDDDDEEITEETLRMIEEGQPSEWDIMKDILGINLFTYILAGLIAFFMSCNLFFGPGWLGQKVGLPGTGTFTEISKSLPDSVDLSKDEFLLN